ncbi:MAG: glycosyl hydrolase [Candidatus Hydrogenedentota bacterium]|nr:MAG: glycosyl hydrolase [Candidatus Hydrogenedentota bacterium]
MRLLLLGCLVMTPLLLMGADAPKVEDGFTSLFNGKDLSGWTGDLEGYSAENGTIICKPGGNLFTEKEYSNFVFRFEFKFTPGANNGLGIRAPKGSTSVASQAMELQILENTAEKYNELEPWQYHGSVYGVVPAKRGFLKPVGEWNSQEVIADGDHITITLNGHVILDTHLKEAVKNGAMDGKDHPGLLRTTGHIAFLGHDDVLWFRNIRIKELP